MLITINKNPETQLFVAGIFNPETKKTHWLEHNDRLQLIMMVGTKLEQIDKEQTNVVTSLQPSNKPSS